MSSGHRFKVTASIVAVVGILLFFIIYKYSGSPKSPVGDLVTDQSRQKGESSGESLPSALSGQHSEKADHSRSDQDVYENETRVSIDVSGTDILLIADQAALQEVLNGLADKALVEVVDMRPEDEPVGEEQQFEKLSFRISGAVDDVLRFVMDQYKYSYTISHLSSAGSQSQLPVVKLFLYGTRAGEGSDYADEQNLSPGNIETTSATGHAESEGRRDGELEKSSERQVNVSEVLRNRALSTTDQPASSADSRTSQVRSPSEGASSGSIPVSGSSDDEAMQSSLADLTRRASEEVKALAEGLKEAEKNLETQRNNEYGESGQ